MIWRHMSERWSDQQTVLRVWKNVIMVIEYAMWKAVAKYHKPRSMFVNPDD